MGDFLENMKAWQAVMASLAAAVLVLLGRASGTRKTIRKDGAEGDLYNMLKEALQTSEDRRAEEAEAYRRREAEHEKRHNENVERMLDLTAQVAEVKGALRAMERQYSDVVNQLQRTDETNKMLVQELAEYRQLFLERLGMSFMAPAPGMPATITKG